MSDTTDTPLISSLKKYIEWNQTKCAQLSVRLTSADPSYGLSDCDDVFEAAEVALDVIQSLWGAEEKGVSEAERVTFLIEYYHHEILSAAKWPKKSTSVTTSLMHQYRTAAMVEMVEFLDEYKKAMETSQDG